MRDDSQNEYDTLVRQLDDLQYYRKNLRSGPSFNMWEQDFLGKVKYRDFDAEEERLLEKEIDIRVRLEELRRSRRGLDEQRLHPASGTRLDEIYPTLPAPGALLRFDPANKMEGRWRHPIENGDPGYRNLATGVKRSYDNMTWTLMSPFVMVRPEAMATLLPREPVLIGSVSIFVQIMVNSVRRDSEILWAPVTDLVLV